MIISFHNMATELVCLKNEEEGQQLYKKAYGLALRILGLHHNLTIHLKGIVNKYKNKERMPEKSSSEIKARQIDGSHLKRKHKPHNFVERNKKLKNFYSIYGYDKELGRKGSNATDLQKPETSFRLPELKQRRQAKDVVISREQSEPKSAN
jgi:hypothetical protein